MSPDLQNMWQVGHIFPFMQRLGDTHTAVKTNFVYATAHTTYFQTNHRLCSLFGIVKLMS